MKRLIITVFVLIVNFSFAQDKQSNSNYIFFNTNIEETHFSKSDFFSKTFFEIEELKSLEPSNNSEGKFPKYESEEIVTNLNEDRIEQGDLFMYTNAGFIEKIIIEKLIETNKISEISQLTDMTKNNKKFEVQNNFPKEEDKLNKVYSLSPKVEVEVGNNIYRYLNKLYKSEIDNTLQNSLNLLAIRF